MTHLQYYTLTLFLETLSKDLQLVSKYEYREYLWNAYRKKTFRIEEER